MSADQSPLATDALAEAAEYARPRRRWTMPRLRRHSLYRRFGWRWCYSPSLDMRDAFDRIGDELAAVIAEEQARAAAALDERNWWHTGAVASVHVYDEAAPVPLTRAPSDPDAAYPAHEALLVGTILASDPDTIVMFEPEPEWCCVCGGDHVFGQPCPPAPEPSRLTGIFNLPGIERRP